MDNQNSPVQPVNNNSVASDLPISEVVSALKNAPPIDITPATPPVAPAVPSMTPSPVLTQTPAAPVAPAPAATPVTPVPIAPTAIAPTNAPQSVSVDPSVVPLSGTKEGVVPVTPTSVTPPPGTLYENPDLVKVPGSK